MTSKKILSTALLAFVCISLGYLLLRQGTETLVFGKSSEAPSTVPSVFEAYYFHGNTRCYTCKTIEDYTKETIESDFPKELASGKLAFQSVNVEESENRHFIQEFQLTNPTVILARKEEGQVLQFKNLNQVWKLVKNKEQFQTYIREEVRAMLKGPL